MKILTIIILIILTLSFISGCTQQKSEQTNITAEVTNLHSCPKGITHDPYPGQCGLYQDTDNNNICDLGE